MIEHHIQQHKKYKILLIGDKGVDVYTYGHIDRISPEAPIPIFNPIRKIIKPGMADNVRMNLETLGCEVTFLHDDVSEKERLIDERSKQQIVRIDRDTKSRAVIVDNIRFDYDAIVISDYNKGTVSYELIEDLIKINLPVFIDTKKQDLARMHGAFVKINEYEYKQRLSINDKLIITLGMNGAMFKTGRDPKNEKFFPSENVEVVDVTGAGDTFLSALVYMYLSSNDIKEAIRFANRAAAITVQHLGCYAPTLKEIK